MKIIACETVHAITLHLRDADLVAPNYGGHSPRPKGFCNREIAWDTKLPPGTASCRACIEIAKQLGCWPA